MCDVTYFCCSLFISAPRMVYVPMHIHASLDFVTQLVLPVKIIVKDKLSGLFYPRKVVSFLCVYTQE